MLHIPNKLRSLSVRTARIASIVLTFFICLAAAQSTQAATVFAVDNAIAANGALETRLKPASPNATTITGRVLSPTGRGLARVFVTLSDANGTVIRMAITNPFGYYRFVDVESGKTYTVSFYSKQYTFLPLVVNTLAD